ncbi:MAG: homocysteine S-methyltransferase family protein [Deltaproteobacteria bacterium]|nr:homocysteine S-methyltransferase family protein [Deltaproteobacteria bacterium]
MARDFRKFLKNNPVIFDGGTGTMLQRLGLKPGGCPDELNLKNPDIVGKVHEAYIKAGSDVVSTNTFGATRTKLAEYGLDGRLKEINAAAAKCARKAAGKTRFVAGDIGPTGRFVEPVGDMDFDEAVEIFTEQADALADAGVDLFIIETVMDIKEMKAAIIAAKSTGLPVAATMTFDLSKRTILGTSPEVFAVVATGLGVDVLGANCSLGIEGIYDVLSVMAKYTDLPLIAQPNAGIPVLKGKETVFPATPEEMAAYVPKLASIGVRALGGCCGTTSDHIEKMAKAFRKAVKKSAKKKDKTDASVMLASRSSVCAFGAGKSPVTIGERINPTGKKALAAEIKEGKTSIIRTEAREQTESGAHILDVNVGVPHVNEPESMKMAVFAVNGTSALPVVVDSSSLEAMEAGLKAVDGRPLINSVSGEEKKIKTVLPLAKKYGAAVLGLTLDDSGIPQTAEGRLKVAKKILAAALKAGLRKEDVVIDCLAMTVSAEPLSARETLRAIRLVKELGLSTVLGVSNISFGLPARETVNSNFLSMCFAAGLDAAIVNTKNKTLMDAYRASMVLLAHDERAEAYIARFKDSASPVGASSPVASVAAQTDVRSKIIKAVVEGDEANIVGFVEEALKEGWEPVKIGNDALIAGLDEVGKLFASNRYFLPQVILSADTVKKAFTRVKQEFGEKKGVSTGKVIMATVEGDIHDIGKNIVCTLLENHGFDVIDLGKNVPAAKIVEEAVKKDVDIVGLSALMTTTVMEMDTVIKKLKEKKVRAKTIVGGAVVTEEFAKRIGADEYGGEATAAVEKMKRLVKTAKGA